jgi:hypothetical protein
VHPQKKVPHGVQSLGIASTLFPVSMIIKKNHFLVTLMPQKNWRYNLKARLMKTIFYVITAITIIISHSGYADTSPPKNLSFDQRLTT